MSTISLSLIESDSLKTRSHPKSSLSCPVISRKTERLTEKYKQRVYTSNTNCSRAAIQFQKKIGRHERRAPTK